MLRTEIALPEVLRRPAEPLRLEKRTTLVAGDRVTCIGYVVCTG